MLQTHVNEVHSKALRSKDLRSASSAEAGRDNIRVSLLKEFAMLSEELLESFRRDGYLILRDVLSVQETTKLQTWAQEVHDWPTDEASPWMPYEVL
jgi:hypothetical protein